MSFSNKGNTAKKLVMEASRDEMNLAEFPLTVLSTRVDPKVKTLEFKDSKKLKNGEVVERQWVITGADKFGLPTATDDDVLLGLIRLTMEQGFRERKVYFTRYELIKALRWSTEGRSYGRITKSLDRLSGVRIKATNAFFDNVTKSFQTCNFGIVDAYEINDERGVKEGSLKDSKGSYFLWSEMLFDSFRAGFIKKIDMDLYFNLQSAVSRRLYRYLDKHFYYRSIVEKNLMNLAFEKIGISRNYKYLSSIKQQIEPAAEELVKKGFLRSFHTSGYGDSTVIRFESSSNQEVFAKSKLEDSPDISTRSELPLNAEEIKSSDAKISATQVSDRQIFEQQVFERRGSNQASKPLAHQNADSIEQNKLAQNNSALNHGSLNPSAKELYNEAFKKLLDRNISPTQIQAILADKKIEQLSKIILIIQHFDSLVNNNDPKISRNQVGFLYRAVENCDSFNLPTSQEGGSFSKASNYTNSSNAGSKGSSSKTNYSSSNFSKSTSQTNFKDTPQVTAKNSFQNQSHMGTSYQGQDSRNIEPHPLALQKQKEYRQYQEEVLNLFKAQLSPTELAKIYADVSSTMSCLKDVLEEKKFKEAVEGCVNDTLSKKAGLKSFQNWLAEDLAPKI